MAGKYKAGQKYLRHRLTGAVFQAHERLAGKTDLVEMLANDDGELEKVEPRVSAETRNKLNPTKTPEKKTAAPAPRAAAPAKPTLTPSGE